MLKAGEWNVIKTKFQVSGPFGKKVRQANTGTRICNWRDHNHYGTVCNRLQLCPKLRVTPAYGHCSHSFAGVQLPRHCAYGSGRMWISCFWLILYMPTINRITYEVHLLKRPKLIHGRESFLRS